MNFEQKVNVLTARVPIKRDTDKKNSLFYCCGLFFRVRKKMTKLPAYINDVPNLSGSEDLIFSARSSNPVFLPQSKIDWDNVKSAFAIALHMHQPIIPDPDEPLTEADEISNLAAMMKHPESGDNHNATVFHQCYKRMGDFIPELLKEGNQPRCMLDYSGVLLHGLYKMGLKDVFENPQENNL